MARKLQERITTGQRLRRERDRLNWSQERLAKEIGTTTLSINRWEHDKRVPQPYYREKLCQVFNLLRVLLLSAYDDVSLDGGDGDMAWLFARAIAGRPVVQVSSRLLSPLHLTAKCSSWNRVSRQQLLTQESIDDSTFTPAALSHNQHFQGIRLKLMKR